MADICISYSRDDSERAQAVRALLEHRGYSVAIDREFLRAGDPFRDEIEAQLRNAKVVVVLWSTTAVQKTFVKDEASRAMRHSVLLQLIIDDMPDDGVPLGFGELQRLRCEWDGRGELAERSGAALLWALRKYLPAVEPIGPRSSTCRPRSMKSWVPTMTCWIRSERAACPWSFGHGTASQGRFVISWNTRRGQPGAAHEVENVAIHHQGFALKEAQIRRFIAALITLAMERDPLPSTPRERDQLGEHWRTAIEVGLVRFIESSRPSALRRSAVVPVEDREGRVSHARK